MSKLIPSDPAKVMSIRSVTPNITTLSVPFSRFGRVKIGGRATLVKLPSGSVAVFSPVALTPEVKSTVAQMGTLKYIAAIDFEHHLFVGPWHKEYPDAKVIAPEGLKEKREGMSTMEKVRFDVTFKSAGHSTHGEDKKEGFSVDEEFDAEFDRTFVPAHANKELVFNFKRDRTLIQGDLMFNLPATEQYSKTGEDPHAGLLTKFFGKFTGTGANIIWQKRLIWYAIGGGDRTGFGKSMKQIEEWDFDKIIPCHGDVIESGGKSVFRNMFDWFLKEKGA